jgi:hypothetical protein
MNSSSIPWAFDWSYNWGTRINYSPQSGMNAFLANGRELQANLTFRPLSWLKLDATLITLDRQKRVRGDVLLTYLIHPGTAFYPGYTDSLENLSLVSGKPFTTARIGFPSTTTQRQFFAKLSYLIRF